MAKDYGRKHSARHRGGASRQILLVLVGFLSGYLSASFFDFAQLVGWVNAQLIANTAVQPAAKPVPQQVQLPKPKFEFYTLLAKDHADIARNAAPQTQVVSVAPTAGSVVGSTPSSKISPVSSAVVAVVSAKQIPRVATINKGAYWVQVGSFKSKQEAERIRASLTLKGFAVNVAAVSQKGMNWYRVTIGPFASRIDAQKAQVFVARTEHITGMVRKMDA